MLTDTQKSQARYDGGKPIADRKAHLARAATAMRKVISDPSVPAIPTITLGDATAMRKALAVMDKIIAQLEQDAREANAIKADYERRLKDAWDALGKLPSSAVDDVVAVASIAMAGLSDLKALTNGTSRTYHPYRPDVQWALRQAARDAVYSLAIAVANRQLDPAAYAESVRGEMQAHKDRHAELIQKLNTLAVAERMEKSA